LYQKNSQCQSLEVIFLKISPWFVQGAGPAVEMTLMAGDAPGARPGDTSEKRIAEVL